MSTMLSDSTTICSAMGTPLPISVLTMDQSIFSSWISSPCRHSGCLRRYRTDDQHHQADDLGEQGGHGGAGDAEPSEWDRCRR